MIKFTTKNYHHPIAVKEFKAAVKQLETEGALATNELPIVMGLDFHKSYTRFGANSSNTDVREQRWYFRIKVEGLSTRDFGPYDDARAALLARDRWLTKIRQVLEEATGAEPIPYFGTSQAQLHQIVDLLTSTRTNPLEKEQS